MAGQRLVAVTGASGYIALHVIAQLLDAQYAVRGTLRDMARAKKVREALNRHTDTSNLSFCECCLLQDVPFRSAICTSECHLFGAIIDCSCFTLNSNTVPITINTMSEANPSC